MINNVNIYDTLVERGYIAQATHEKEIRDLLGSERVTFYIGYDPTADSLHVGHFLTLMAMAHLQRAGHRPIALMGGGTGMIGDPDKADTMRPLMDVAQIDHNIECFKVQMAKFIDFSDDKAIMANNADWLRHLNYADFIREYGVHFSVNRMLAADKYKIKFEGSGLNFFELNYVVMQAYDFLELNRRFGCTMQFGGSDQWSNIIAGTELIRRIDGKNSYGLTFNLLTTSQDAKMGKTMAGAVWLNPEKTSPYEFYQYWRNVEDVIVGKLLRLLTFLPMEEIKELETLKDKEINKAKEVLAYEITKIVHSEEDAKAAEEASKALFAGGNLGGSIPETELSASDVENGINIIELLEKAGLIPSRGEGRRLISGGGVKVNDVKISNHEHIVLKEDFADNEIMIQKGKKTFHRIKLV
ncbi:MAG: tyrosine--tRNA ligase [Defluviitaleaceae bacterium]|nr:tyrosine--tRNA ligase [Defluviitaleaceae bacterium]